MEPILIAKLSGLGIIIVSSCLCAIIPFCLRRLLSTDGTSDGSGTRSKKALALSCIQCLAGGVLLSTVFTHMLPELREGLDEDVPLAEILLCAGMFAIYAIEECVTLVVHRSQSQAHHNQHQHEHLKGNSNVAFIGKPSDVGPTTGISNYGSIRDVEGDACSEVIPAESQADHGHSHLPAPGGGSLRVFVVALALSIHSIFDGLAIGLGDTATSTWMLITAISVHKTIISFCLGQQLAASVRSRCHSIVTLLVFLAATPIGVCIGLSLTASGEGSHSVAPAALQALAAGTILYVVMFEIIVGERAKPGGGLVKLVAIAVGFGLMLMLTLLVKEPEEHSHGPTTTTTTPASVPTVAV